MAKIKLNTSQKPPGKSTVNKSTGSKSIGSKSTGNDLTGNDPTGNGSIGKSSKELQHCVYNETLYSTDIKDHSERLKAIMKGRITTVIEVTDDNDKIVFKPKEQDERFIEYNNITYEKHHPHPESISPGYPRVMADAQSQISCQHREHRPKHIDDDLDKKCDEYVAKYHKGVEQQDIEERDAIDQPTMTLPPLNSLGSFNLATSDSSTSQPPQSDDASSSSGLDMLANAASEAERLSINPQEVSGSLVCLSDFDGTLPGFKQSAFSDVVATLAGNESQTQPVPKTKKRNRNTPEPETDQKTKKQNRNVPEPQIVQNIPNALPSSSVPVVFREADTTPLFMPPMSPVAKIEKLDFGFDLAEDERKAHVCVDPASKNQDGLKDRSSTWPKAHEDYLYELVKLAMLQLGREIAHCDFKAITEALHRHFEGTAYVETGKGRKGDTTEPLAYLERGWNTVHSKVCKAAKSKKSDNKGSKRYEKLKAELFPSLAKVGPDAKKVTTGGKKNDSADGMEVDADGMDGGDEEVEDVDEEMEEVVDAMEGVVVDAMGGISSA